LCLNSVVLLFVCNVLQLWVNRGVFAEYIIPYQIWHGTAVSVPLVLLVLVLVRVGWQQWLGSTLSLVRLSVCQHYIMIIWDYYPGLATWFDGVLYDLWPLVKFITNSA